MAPRSSRRPTVLQLVVLALAAAALYASLRLVGHSRTAVVALATIDIALLVLALLAWRQANRRNRI